MRDARLVLAKGGVLGNEAYLLTFEMLSEEQWSDINVLSLKAIGTNEELYGPWRLETSENCTLTHLSCG